MTCAGNGTEFCGGPGRLNVLNYTGPAGSLPAQKPTPPAGGGGGGGVSGGGGGGGVSTSPVYTVSSGLPTGWAYNSCYVYVSISRHGSLSLTTSSGTTRTVASSPTSSQTTRTSR
jgi:hypothetical protein